MHSSAVIERASATFPLPASPARGDAYQLHRSFTEPLKAANQTSYEISDPARLDIETLDALKRFIDIADKALNTRVTREELEALLAPLITDREATPELVAAMIAGILDRDALDHYIDGAVSAHTVAIAVGRLMRKPGLPSADEFCGATLRARLTIEKILKRLLCAQGIEIR
jgi:predicted RNA-binding Zn ribbon-like protein